MGSVRGDIAALVVSVDGEIAPDALLHLVTVVAKHVGVVAGPIEADVGGDDLALLIPVPIDDGRQLGHLGQDAHHIVVVVGPVVGLLHALVVLVEELAVPLEEENGQGQHRHGVGLLRDGGHQLDILLGEAPVAPELVLQVVELVLGGELARQQQVHHALGQGLVPAGGFLGLLLHLGDGVTPEGDSRNGVQLRALVVQGWHFPHPRDDLVHLDLSDLLVPVLLLQGVELFISQLCTVFVFGDDVLRQVLLQLREQLSAASEVHIYKLILLNYINSSFAKKSEPPQR